MKNNKTINFATVLTIIPLIFIASNVYFLGMIILPVSIIFNIVTANDCENWHMPRMILNFLANVVSIFYILNLMKGSYLDIIGYIIIGLLVLLSIILMIINTILLKTGKEEKAIGKVFWIILAIMLIIIIMIVGFKETIIGTNIKFKTVEIDFTDLLKNDDNNPGDMEAHYSNRAENIYDDLERGTYIAINSKKELEDVINKYIEYYTIYHDKYNCFKYDPETCRSMIENQLQEQGVNEEFFKKNILVYTVNSNICGLDGIGKIEYNRITKNLFFIEYDDHANHGSPYRPPNFDLVFYIIKGKYEVKNYLPETRPKILFFS